MKQLNLLEMKTKRCSKCGEVKPFSEFNKDKRAKDKLRSECKECRKEYREKNSEYNKNWQKNNPEYFKNYHQKNKEQILKKQKKWWENNPEYMKEWKENNPEKVKENKKKFNKRYFSIPKNRLSRAISSAIYHSLKGNKKGNHWEDLVDFTLQTLRPHLEDQFKPGMSWNNYGKDGWEIDHIKPKAKFNFTSYKDKEFKECWALKNLKPLWDFENRSKGAKY